MLVALYSIIATTTTTNLGLQWCDRRFTHCSNLAALIGSPGASQSMNRLSSYLAKLVALLQSLSRPAATTISVCIHRDVLTVAPVSHQLYTADDDNYDA